MSKRLLPLIAGLLLVAATAEARMHAPYRGHRIVASGAAPLDTFTTPAAAYSFRKLRSAYAGPALRLRRATGGEQDINFLDFSGFTGAPIDIAAAGTFCAATTCFGVSWYDQGGLAHHATQTNPAAQPSFTFNCVGTLPCFTATTGQFLQAPDVTPAAGPASFSTVQRVAGAGGLCYGMQAANQLLGINGATMVLYNGAAITQPASAAAWHSSQGVINGAASVLGLDGVETTGSVAPVTTVGPIYTAYNGGTPACNYAEAVWWNNYALTATERAAVATNQRNFWGF